MSGVFVTITGRRPLQVGRHVRNGFSPAAELQDALAELAGHATQARTKAVFRSLGGLATGDLASAIPNSDVEGGDRNRWRFAWHSGPYARYLWVRFEMARQNNGTPTSPFGRLRVLDSAGDVVGDAYARAGSASGATDVPGMMAQRETQLVTPGSDDNALVELEPDTDYFATFSEHDFARIQSAMVYEISLDPDTDNGYAERGQAAGSPIYDRDRETPLTMARSLWRRGGAHLWNWFSELDSEAPTTSSSTYRNLVDDTSTTPAFAPGVRLDLNGRARASDVGVPVVLKVYATGDAGEVRLVNDDGDTMLACVIDDGEGWYAVQGTLPAADGKYLLHYGCASGELTVYATSLYQCDTFEEWTYVPDPPEPTLTLGVTDTVDPISGLETTNYAVTVTVGGVEQTELQFTIATDDLGIEHPAPPEPTDLDLDGWSTSGWSEIPGVGWVAVFARATHEVGSSTLVFEQGVGSAGTYRWSISGGFSAEVAEGTLIDGGFEDTVVEG